MLSDAPDKFADLATWNRWVTQGEQLEQRGTHLAGTGLCFHCRRAWITRSARQTDPVILCTYPDPQVRVPPDILECNKYDKVGGLSLYEMGELAELVGEKRPRAGFLHEFALPPQDGPQAAQTGPPPEAAP
jgi:hypothetical protein